MTTRLVLKLGYFSNTKIPKNEPICFGKTLKIVARETQEELCSISPH